MQSIQSKRVAVVILNWNGKSFLEKFLPGVVRHSSGMADVVVADNASSDSSIDFLEQNFPEVRLIRIPENKGFTGGYNFALNQIETDYFVLLNSDVEVTEGWIEPIIQLMDSDARIAACQPKIRSYDRKDEFEYAGASGGFIDKYGYPFCRGRIFQYLEKDLGQYNSNLQVFWVTGAAMFIRSSVFHELNGLDDNFFAHMEEIDLCWRIQKAGYKVYVCPASVIYHVGGGTLPKNNPRKTYFNFRNNLLMIYKNSTKEGLRRLLLMRTFLDVVAAFRFLVGTGTGDFSAVFRAHRDFHRIRKLYHGVPQAKNLVPNSEITTIYRKSIIWSYYIRGKKIFSDLDFRQLNEKTSS